MPQPNNRGRLRAFLASYWTPAGRQAFRNLLGMVICTGISQACSFGTLLILTRSLSQDEFGAVIFALNVQAYLVTLGTFGQSTIVVRDLTQQPSKTDETTTAFLTIVGGVSVATGLLTAVVVALVPISWDERAMLWCLAAGNVFACLSLNPLYDAAHRQALAAVLLLPGDIAGVAALYLLARTSELSVPIVGAIILAKLSLATMLQASAFGRWVRPLRGAWDRQRLGQMVRAGRPMLLAGLLYSIPMSGSVVLVRVLRGEAETALYGLAFQFVMAELMVVVLVLRVLQPHISSPYGVAPRFLWQLAAMGLAGLTFLCTASVAVCGFVVYWLLPSGYQPAYILLLIFQLFLVCYCLAAVFNAYLIRFHMERWVTVVCVVSVAAYLASVAIGWRSSHGFATAVACSSTVLVVGSGVGIVVLKRAHFHMPFKI